MLEDNVLLVTGGTGAIGEAICRTAAREGADVAFTFGTRAEKAQQLAAELARAGRRCVYDRVPATDGAAVNAFCARVEQTLGRIDALVNNVGAAQAMPFPFIEEEDWDRAMGVNLKSMFLFTKAVVRGMIRRRKGVVVNVGSIGGRRLLDVPVHYAAAKAGVTGFTLALAKEVARYQIRVLEVSPGLIEGGVGSNASESQQADYLAHCAAGRMGKPEEVAELVAFLASSRARYINATTIAVDGGL